MYATAYQMFSLLDIFCKHRQIEDMCMLPRAYMLPALSLLPLAVSECPCYANS